MNTVQLIGNMTKKEAVAYFTVANNDNKEKTVYTEVTAFGTTAEYINSYLSTGCRVAIQGALGQRPNKTANGDSYSQTYVICHRLENLSPKREG